MNRVRKSFISQSTSLDILVCCIEISQQDCWLPFKWKWKTLIFVWTTRSCLLELFREVHERRMAAWDRKFSLNSDQLLRILTTLSLNRTSRYCTISTLKSPPNLPALWIASFRIANLYCLVFTFFSTSWSDYLSLLTEIKNWNIREMKLKVNCTVQIIIYN